MPHPWKLNLGQYSKLKVTAWQNSRGKLKYQTHIDEDNIIGFVVVSGGRGGGAFISPIYGGNIVVSPTDGEDKNTKYYFATYQRGERLNGLGYSDDPDGNVLATIAATAINQLQARSVAIKRKKK